MKARFRQLMDCIPLINNSTKIKISISLLIFALLAYVVYPESLDRKLCLIAMFFSLLGDISLNCMPIKDRPKWLMYIGALFFMVAHLVYASAYYSIIGNLYEFINPGAIMAYVFMVLFVIVAIVCVVVSKQSLEIPMVLVFGIYIAIIGINFITICTYSWTAKALSFVGALSFLISDFIIGIETVFKIKNDILRKLVWIFYPIGQILIIACR